MSYSQTDVFVICYSVVDKDSFSSIETKWIPELKRYSTNAPIIIVGTKADLAETVSESEVVSEEAVKRFVSKVNAAGHITCSAKTRYNLENAFQLAINAVLYPQKKEDEKERTGNGCCLIC